MASFQVELDEQVLRDAWEDVRSDDTETAWMTAGYDTSGKTAKIVLLGKGTGGRTECLASIAGATEIVFGGFRLTAVDDRGSTVSRRAKFIFFMYRPAEASSMAKAKAGAHLGTLEPVFQGLHAQFAVDALHELSEAEIVRKLRQVGGAHQPTGFDFGAGDVGEGAEEAAPAAAAASNPADAAPNNATAPALAVPTTGQAADVEVVAAGMSAVTVSADTTGPSTPSAAGEVLVLVSSMPSTSIIEGNQTTLRNVFRGRKIATTEVDGVQAENKELRTEMFNNSGKRGCYPQVFIRTADGLRFVGDFDEIQSLNDSDSLPKELLDANPGIPTFTKVFKAFMT